MPREDRQLLMLRFIREVDQSVDYAEVNASPNARVSCDTALVSIRDGVSCVLSGLILHGKFVGETTRRPVGSGEIRLCWI